MLKALPLLALLVTAMTCAHGSPACVQTYRGVFMYSWEGGGFFVPCDGGPGQPRAALGRRFFAQLRADSIHWPAGLAPDRTREGAITFVVLRTPRLVSGV